MFRRPRGTVHEAADNAQYRSLNQPRRQRNILAYCTRRYRAMKIGLIAPEGSQLNSALFTSSEETVLAGP